MLDVFLVVTTILMAWIGWSIGLTRVFFSVFAGFISIVIIFKYVFQEGSNFFLIFTIVLLSVVLIYSFISKTVNFFHLNILDRFGGMLLGLFIWFILFVNIVVPTVNYKGFLLNKLVYTTVHTFIDDIIYSKISVIYDYIIQLFEIKK
ncbi:MAG: hypothetical protein LBQ07_00340 [Endomicrobium sp.]|jgi:uncharacterized membrane protein required for colicin V production|nr:hypothetical protein [Endomicrobium sp.]